MDNQIQAVLTEAIKLYKTLCPDGEELSSSDWPDLWHEICQPLEVAVRAEMRRAGCCLERWMFLE